MEAAAKATHPPRPALRAAIVPRSVPRRGAVPAPGSRVLGAAKALGSPPFVGGAAQDQDSGGVRRTSAPLTAPKGTKVEVFFVLSVLVFCRICCGS